MRDRRAQLDPAVECLFAFVAFDGEHVAQSFFEEVGAPQSRVGLGDPVELVALTAGEVAGVLPQRVAGLCDVLARRRSSGLVGERRAVERRPLASFQARRRSMSSASIAHATTWNGSAQRNAFGARRATTRAIQSAMSAETWVSCAARSGPSSSKNTFSAASLRPGPAHTSRPLSWSTTTIR